jgi:hypothetical protein
VSEPFIRMELVDGTNTWVTVMPIRNIHDAEQVAGQAYTMFFASLVRDDEAVRRHLVRAFAEEDAA